MKLGKIIVAILMAMAGGAYAAEFTGLQVLKAPDIKAVAAEVPAPAVAIARVAMPEDSQPLTAVGNAAVLVAARDILIPPNLYQMYLQDGELAVTAYRTKSFCKFLVIGSPARRVLKKGTRIMIKSVPHTNAYLEDLDVQLDMDYLNFNDSYFYAVYCVGENPVPNGFYLGAPKFTSTVTIGEMKKLLNGYFEFKK